MKDEG